MTCSYFDDLFMYKGFDYLISEGYMSPEEAQVVKTFHEMYDNYPPPNDDEYNHNSIFDDPKWQKLNKSAAKACADLYPLLTDSKEIN